MERRIRTALIFLLGLNTSFAVVPYAIAQHSDTDVQEGATSTTQDTSPQFGQPYGPVKNQTLWSISKELVKNTEFSIQQGVDAIVAKNQGAFRSGNAHQIKKGVVLSLPKREEMGMRSDANAKPMATGSEYDVHVNHAAFITAEEE
jgi:FimV-like protein